VAATKKTLKCCAAAILICVSGVLAYLLLFIIFWPLVANLPGG